MTRPRHLTHLPTLALLLGLAACASLQTVPPERDAAHRLERGLAALDAGQYRTAFEDLSWVYTRCEGHVRGAEALAALAALELDPRNRAGRPGVGTDLLGRVIQDPTPPDWVRPLAETGYLMALALGAPPAEADTAGAAIERARGAEAPAVPAGAPLDTAQVRDTAQARERDPAQPRDRAGVQVERARQVLPAAGDERASRCGPAIATDGWVAPSLPQLPGPSLVALLAEAESGRAAASTRADSLARQLAEMRRRLEETQAELERIRKTLKP